MQRWFCQYFTMYSNICTNFSDENVTVLNMYDILFEKDKVFLAEQNLNLNIVTFTRIWCEFLWKSIIHQANQETILTNIKCFLW